MLHHQQALLLHQAIITVQAVAAATPEVKITANGGSADAVNVTAVVKLTVEKGTNAAETSSNLPVNLDISEASETGQAEITSGLPVAITTKTTVNVTITLEATANGSTIKAEQSSKEVTVPVTNKTTTAIEIKDSNDQTLTTAPANATTPTNATVGASNLEKSIM